MCVCTCMLCHSPYISSGIRFGLGGVLWSFLGSLMQLSFSISFLPTYWACMYRSIGACAIVHTPIIPKINPPNKLFKFSNRENESVDEGKKNYLNAFYE